MQGPTTTGWGGCVEKSKISKKQLKCRCLQAGRRIMGLGDDGILTTASRERNVLDKAAADAKAALATPLGTGPTSTMKPSRRLLVRYCSCIPCKAMRADGSTTSICPSLSRPSHPNSTQHSCRRSHHRA